MPYLATQLALPDVLMLEPKIFDDKTGVFFESFNQRDFTQATGLTVEFVQDNHSRSERNVLRGLHYQIVHPQGKLVRVTLGSIFDVSVDLRRSSSSFGKWVGVELSAENKKQLWIPPGFAHGFVVTSEAAEVLYKTTEYYAPEHECCIAWDDPTLGIQWPRMNNAPRLSAKDAAGKSFAEAFALGHC